MEKIDIIFWILGGGFGFMVLMWNSLNKKIDDLLSNFSKRLDDLSSNTSKRLEDLAVKVDRNEAKFNAKLDTKIDPIEKDLVQISTKIAVIESRLADISTNVTYLMWHHQAVPPKDEIKEN